MTKTCQCCNGALPDQEIWEANRHLAGECTGGVDQDGRCLAFSDDKLWSMPSKITSITVYWDTQDPSNEGWAYCASNDAGLVASGGIEDVAEDDLCGAIDEACRELGVDLTHDDFGMQPHVDGGCAKWMSEE